MNKYTRLITDSAITINRVTQVLEANSINFQIRDNVNSARLAGFGSAQNDVELHVAESDLEKAQAIVKSLFAED